MGKKVLIVEDEPELLAIMAAAFARRSWRSTPPATANWRWSCSTPSGPTWVITDIVMPAKEGMALIMDIKKSPSDAPVIAISGGGTRACRDNLRWAKELGSGPGAAEAVPHVDPAHDGPVPDGEGLDPARSHAEPHPPRDAPIRFKPIRFRRGRAPAPGRAGIQRPVRRPCSRPPWASAPPSNPPDHPPKQRPAVRDPDH
ncbi:MAG: response regulator [Caulobacteraceae bacterium]